jgi:hypothetical protein
LNEQDADGFDFEWGSAGKNPQIEDKIESLKREKRKAVQEISGLQTKLYHAN